MPETKGDVPGMSMVIHDGRTYYWECPQTGDLANDVKMSWFEAEDGTKLSFIGWLTAWYLAYGKAPANYTIKAVEKKLKDFGVGGGSGESGGVLISASPVLFSASDIVV